MRKSCLVWSIELIDNTNRTGSAEFVVPAAPADTFFPIEVRRGTVAGVGRFGLFGRLAGWGAGWRLSSCWLPSRLKHLPACLGPCLALTLPILSSSLPCLPLPARPPARRLSSPPPRPSATCGWTPWWRPPAGSPSSTAAGRSWSLRATTWSDCVVFSCDRLARWLGAGWLAMQRRQCSSPRPHQQEWPAAAPLASLNLSSPPLLLLGR